MSRTNQEEMVENIKNTILKCVVHGNDCWVMRRGAAPILLKLGKSSVYYFHSKTLESLAENDYFVRIPLWEIEGVSVC